MSFKNIFSGTDKGPHHIPDLDPDEPGFRSQPGYKKAFIWAFFAGLVLLALGGVAGTAGFPELMIILLILGAVLLLPIMLISMIGG